MKWDLWTPENVIGLIIVVGCIALLLCGIDGEVKGILAVAAGWIFNSATRKNTIKEVKPQ